MIMLGGATNVNMYLERYHAIKQKQIYNSNCFRIWIYKAGFGSFFL